MPDDADAIRIRRMGPKEPVAGVRSVLEIKHAAQRIVPGALGDPGRLGVLVLLAQGEWCVSELAAALDDGLSTVSHRLRLLQ